LNETLTEQGQSGFLRESRFVLRFRVAGAEQFFHNPGRHCRAWGIFVHDWIRDL
jgi:hypothetical protein